MSSSTSSRYQRQMGRKSQKPNIYGPSSGGGGGSGNDNDDPLSEAAARAEKSRRLRLQRQATQRRENAALDSKFGFDEFDHRSVMELRNKLVKKERKEKMLAAATADMNEKNDAVLKGSSSGLNGDDDDKGGLALLPGASGQRRGWVFNMVPTTLPPASNDDVGSAAGGGGSSSALDGNGGGGFVGAGEEDGGGDGDVGSSNERSAVELFLIDEENRRFKATVVHEPYFYLIPEDKTQQGQGSHMMMMSSTTTFASPTATTTSASSSSSAAAAASKKLEEMHSHDKHDLQFNYQELLAALLRLYQPKGLNRVEILRKMDLDAPNHLGLHSQTLGGRPVIKLIFDNVDQLQRVKKEVMDVLQMNERKRADRGEEFDLLAPMMMYDANYVHSAEEGNSSSITARKEDPLSTLLDIREHDVPYLVRVCIDLNLRAGCWYTLTPLSSGGVSLSDRGTLPKANPKVLAFDIECTKAPLKFPDAEFDSIFMISYMIDGQGYLILSRHVVGKDVANFEYTPKPKYPGPFVVINEMTEEALIRRFLLEFEKAAPQIVVTYNGDFFDWPFLERRAAVYGLDLRREIGFYDAAAVDSANGSGGGGGGGNADSSSEYRGRTAVHLDAFRWVKRDSYLPQGSQGLKAVTKYKLGYDPVEVDPEDMVRFARDRPAHMARYSVSDAVATYYLYDKYVHLFIFSLCTVIPMGPEDVLRKGSGELNIQCRRIYIRLSTLRLNYPI